MASPQTPRTLRRKARRLHHSTTSIASHVSWSAATSFVAPEVWRGDELEVVAGPDLDHAGADALHAGFALAIEGYPQRR
jgi:hypothetical protein